MVIFNHEVVRMRFYIVFGATILLTICCGLAALTIIILKDGQLSDGEKNVLSTTTFLFSAGMGVVIGLLAGSRLDKES